MDTKTVRIVVLAGLLPWSTQVEALSCVQLSPEDFVKRYEHIFVVQITEAKFTPNNNPHSGTIISNFRVEEIIHGDPAKVPYIQASVSPNQDYPPYIPIGQRYFIYANDGPAMGTL